MGDGVSGIGWRLFVFILRSMLIYHMSHEMPPNGGFAETPGSNLERLMTIKLNPDPEIQQKLKSKLADYEARLDARIAEGKYNDMDTAFKAILLKELLEKGLLDVDSIHEKYFSIPRPESHKDDFWNALNVIEQYNKGTTEQLQGGTGF